MPKENLNGMLLSYSKSQISDSYNFKVTHFEFFTAAFNK